MGGDVVRVVRRAVHHRENGAGIRIERDDRTLETRTESVEVGQTLLRDLLRLGVDRQRDVAALRLVVADEVDDAVHEQPVVVSGQDVVLRVLQLATAVGVGVEAGEMGIQVRRGVRALVVVLVVAVDAPRDRIAVDQDRPAVAGELLIEYAPVAGAVVEVVRLYELHVVRIHQQCEEQQ